jgi:GDP-4-dehydro-6-deoxy-D-mannose reductase
MTGAHTSLKDFARQKVLITGAEGFVGRHLTTALRDRHPGWSLDALAGPPAKTGIDVTDALSVEARIRESRPDIVVHLAAVAAVPTSVKDPRLAWRVNLDGTLNVVLAMQAHAPDAHLLFVSSAEVYGDSLNAAEPVTEAALLQPLNPYAASKASADILVRQAMSGGLSATIMRPFNHTGLGQSDAFVVPDFAAQIVRIEAGLQEPVIEVGSLDDQRDFLDVADVIDAYLLMLERRHDPALHDVFNVASGVAVRIGDLLDRLLSMAKRKIAVRVDNGRLRPARVQRVVGDASRLRAMGWAPIRSLDQTLTAILEDRRRPFNDEC